MKNLKLVLLIAVLFTSQALRAETKGNVTIQPDQCVVQVSGVVCSFCAYGTEKNLSKLKFLNGSLFGNGVLMDIFKNRITLALKPGEPLDLKSIHRAIKKGGYDPLTVYLRLAGHVEKKDNHFLLTHTRNGQVFELTGDQIDQLSRKQVVEVQAHLDAERIPSLPEGKPIPVVLDKVWGVS